MTDPISGDVYIRLQQPVVLLERQTEQYERLETLREAAVNYELEDLMHAIMFVRGI